MALAKLQEKFGSRILGQIPGQPIFLIEVDDKKGLDKKIKKEKDIGDVEKDGPVTLTGKKKSTPDSSTNPLGLDQSVMSLFQSVMSLFGDDSLTNFYGTDVREAYAYQPALDVVRVSDIRNIATGAGARIAFIDTGVDPHHPALGALGGTRGGSAGDGFRIGIQWSGSVRHVSVRGRRPRIQERHIGSVRDVPVLAGTSGGYPGPVGHVPVLESADVARPGPVRDVSVLATVAGGHIGPVGHVPGSGKD